MELLPQPQRRTARAGQFCLRVGTMVALQNTAPTALLYAQMLQQAACRYTGFTPAITRGAARPGDMTLCLTPSLPADHYTISISDGELLVRAGGDEALCNAVQTLCQLMARHGAVLPGLELEDWPALPARGYYLDCSRGRVPTLQTLKQQADLLCRYKINQWQLYIEHTYLFRDLSEAWRDDTPLTAQEILELDAYCAARHIELVPSLSTFGHMYKILSTKTHCDLCELEGADRVPFTYTESGKHHTINAADPAAQTFILALIDEYRALFSSRKFNICADETFDLGKGRSRELAETIGQRALYVRHVGALCRHLLDNGCTPMFWGDMMWHFPDACTELPKGTVCLNWGYLPRQRENEMRDIAQTGTPQYACPGVCGWKCWMPLLHTAYCNIRVMCDHAKKYHAIGLLNTDWGDYGHINDPRLSTPGILYGAAFAWNMAPVPFEELNAAISFLEYGDTSETLVGAMASLSGQEVFDWRHAVNWLEAESKSARDPIFAELDMSKAAPAQAAVAKAEEEILNAARTLPQGQKQIVETLCLTAQSIRLWNEIGVWLAKNCYGQPLPAQNGNDLAVQLEHWLALYRAAWRTTCKESGLPRLTQLICDYADVLRGCGNGGKGAAPGR